MFADYQPPQPYPDPSFSVQQPQPYPDPSFTVLSPANPGLTAAPLPAMAPAPPNPDGSDVMGWLNSKLQPLGSSATPQLLQAFQQIGRQYPNPADQEARTQAIRKVLAQHLQQTAGGNRPGGPNTLFPLNPAPLGQSGPGQPGMSLPTLPAPAPNGLNRGMQNRLATGKALPPGIQRKQPTAAGGGVTGANGMVTEPGGLVRSGGKPAQGGGLSVSTLPAAAPAAGGGVGGATYGDPAAMANARRRLSGRPGVLR